MRTSSVTWVGCGVALWLGAAACSGTSLNEVGEVNGGSGGSGGSAIGGSSGNTGGDRSTPGGGGSGRAGSGGAVGGAGRIELGAGGEAGAPEETGPLNCPACVAVAADEDVRDVAVNDQNVYWVDYGTSDELGNYEGNGRLLSRGLAGGATTVLADSLPGPESVSLSTAFAYLFVDRRGGAARSLGIVRVPLAGGDAQPVQSLADAEWSTYRVFAFGSGNEYWNWGGVVYRIAETAGASVETFVAARGVRRILTDDALLYFQDATGIWTMPEAGGDPTMLYAADESASIELAQVSGDYVYAQENSRTASVSDSYLTRMPKAGGAWKRLAASPDYLSWSQLEIVGDEYFVDQPTKSRRQIVQASLLAPASRTTLASEAAPTPYWNAWTPSSIGVFLADPTGLYLTPIATP